MNRKHIYRQVKRSRDDKLSLLEQVRFACKYYDNIERVSDLPLAYQAREFIQSPRFLHRKDSDHYEIAGWALLYMIDICMDELKPIDPNSLLGEAYYCLYDYIYLSGQTYRSNHLSRSTYYNRVNLGIVLLAQHINLFFASFTGQSELIELPTRKKQLLSPKELEVLTLAAQGINEVKVVAERMHVSKGTITTYWRRIRAKLGVASRAEAIIIALRLGLVSL